MVEIHCIE